MLKGFVSILASFYFQLSMNKKKKITAAVYLSFEMCRLMEPQLLVFRKRSQMVIHVGFHICLTIESELFVSE